MGGFCFAAPRECRVYAVELTRVCIRGYDHALRRSSAVPVKSNLAMIDSDTAPDDEGGRSRGRDPCCDETGKTMCDSRQRSAARFRLRAWEKLDKTSDVHVLRTAQNNVWIAKGEGNSLVGGAERL